MTTTDALIHRIAGQAGVSCTPKRSSIDKRYFAEIARHHTKADGSYSHSDLNIALGTGDTGIEAALDGYRQVLPDEPRFAMLAALIRAENLAAKCRQLIDRTDTALTTLHFVVGMVNIDLDAPRPMPAKPGEDDDL